ncbi:MAG: DUF1524 domain-containing protein, partial [Fusobacteriaceae bacterium]|nr:DUF1524 domain-containing protein [Fusobacteriaceae bacterium]
KLLKESFPTTDDSNKFPENKFNDIVSSIESLNDIDDISDEIKQLVNGVDSELSDFFNMHGISNMALLDKETNSSFNNDPFKSKREKLINIDKLSWRSEEKEKPFIPIGTKNVFLKYTTSEIKQMEIWGWQDREDYYNHIKSSLKKYLPTSGANNG